MTPYAFHVLDVIAFGVVVVSAIVASFRGFTREFFGIVSWIAALFAGAYGTQATFSFWKEFLQNDLLANVFGFVVFFVVTLTFFLMASAKIVEKIGDTALNILDRSAGFLFGFARGIVILALGYLVIASFAETDKELPEWAKQSRFLPQIQQSARVLVKLLPYDDKKNKDPNAKDGELKDGDKALEENEKKEDIDAISEEEKEPAYNKEQRNEMDQLSNSVEE